MIRRSGKTKTRAAILRRTPRSFARIWGIEAMATALVGSSTALDAAILAAHGGVSPNGGIPDQAHHLLSSNVVISLDEEFEHTGTAGLKLAFASGYQLNAAPNGILLPTHFGHQMKV